MVSVARVMPLIAGSAGLWLAGCGVPPASLDDAGPDAGAAPLAVPDAGSATAAGEPGPNVPPSPPPPAPSEDAGSPGAPETDAGAPAEPSLPPAFEGNFTGSAAFDGQNRLLAFVYRKPGAGGHDHVIRSPNFSGTLSYRIGDLSACAVSVTVPTANLINDEDELRAEQGMPDLSEDFFGWVAIGGQDQVRNNMLAENQLDAVGHPNITFTSTGCVGEPLANANILVSGQMTLRGVTRPVTWNATFNATENDVRATGTLSIRQSDFGITPYAFLGFENDDEVDLEFSIRVTD